MDIVVGYYFLCQVFHLLLQEIVLQKKDTDFMTSYNIYAAFMSEFNKYCRED